MGSSFLGGGGGLPPRQFGRSGRVNHGFERTTGENLKLTDLVKFYTHSIVSDEMDKDLYKIALSQSQKLSDTEKRLKKEGFKTYSHLQEDAFSALFKAKPVLRDARIMDHEYLLNQMVMEAAMQTSGYRELRSLTLGDDIASIVGTESLIEILEKLLKDKKEQMQKEQEAAEKAQKELQELIQQMQQNGENGDKGEGEPEGEGEGEGEGDENQASGQPKPGQDRPGNKKGNIAGPQKPSLTIEQAMKRAEETRNQLRQKVQSVIVPQLTDALRQSNIELKKYSELIQQWGLDAAQTAQRMSAQDRIKLIDRIRNSHKLREIAKLLGKFKPIASSLEKQRVKTVPMRVQKISFGDNIGRTIPADIALHSNPRTKKLFYKKLLEKQLRVVQYDGHKTLGKGPIVLCLDESGSMSGSPEEWGKAVGLTLLDMAKNQNRDFVFIHFDARKADELRCDYYLKEEGVDPLKIIETAEHFYGGGTSFEDPLDRARELIDSHAAFSKADIIFITDGECGVGNTWLTEFKKWKDEKHIRILSVMIDSGYHSDGILHKFSDHVTALGDLQADGDSTAINIFETLNT